MVNPTQTTTLAGFLLARIAEDEVVANAAGAASWYWTHGFGEMCGDETCPFGQLMAATEPYPTQLMDVHGFDIHEPWQGADHIARHDPARVIAECAAKRAVVELHSQRPTDDDPTRTGCQVCDYDGDCSWQHSSGPTGACDTIRALAQPYAAHPDFDPSWAVTQKKCPTDR